MFDDDEAPGSIEIDVLDWPYGVTDLKLVNGVYQPPLPPHEDIHHPDHFEAKKEFGEHSWAHLNWD